MAKANEVRVKVTLKVEKKNGASSSGKVWYEFLGEYVFPPSSASLRMCCGKRVFERIYDGQKSIFGYKDWFIYFSDYYRCWLVGREQDMEAGAGWVRSSICGQNDEMSPGLDPPATFDVEVENMRTCSYPTHPPWQYYDGSAWQFWPSLQVTVEGLAPSVAVPEIETKAAHDVECKSRPDSDSVSATSEATAVCVSDSDSDSDWNNIPDIAHRRDRDLDFPRDTPSQVSRAKPLFGRDGLLVTKIPRVVSEDFGRECLTQLAKVEKSVRLIRIDRKYTGREVVDYVEKLMTWEEPRHETNRPRTVSTINAHTERIIDEAWRKHQAKKHISDQMNKKVDAFRSLLQNLKSPAKYLRRGSSSDYSHLYHSRLDS